MSWLHSGSVISGETQEGAWPGGQRNGLACGVQSGHTFLLSGVSQLADVGREVELKRGEVSRGAVVREKNGWIREQALSPTEGNG